MRIKIDDFVEVIAGDDSGARGKVLKVLADKNRILVEGVNRVRKHVRRSQRNPRGGQLSKEMPISASNVLLICSACGKPTRQGVRFQDDGSKQRFCKKCGATTGDIAPPHKSHAKAK